MPASKPQSPGDGDPLSYRDAVIYEVYVRAFYDPGSNGLSDFRRLAQELELYPYEPVRTNCENLTETYPFLKELRARIHPKYRDRMLLAETNQWPENAIAYFGSKNECDTAFHSEAPDEPVARIRMLARAILELWEQS